MAWALTVGALILLAIVVDASLLKRKGRALLDERLGLGRATGWIRHRLSTQKTVRGHRVILKQVTSGHLTVTVRFLRGRAPSIWAFSKARLAMGAVPDFARPHVLTGDELFDRDVSVRGHELEALAIFDQNTRDCTRRLFRDRSAELTERGLTLHTTRWRLDAAWLNSLIDEALDAIDRLSVEPEEIETRVARNALSDPVAGVRARNLTVLLTRFVDTDGRTTAARRSLRDPDPRVRLIAAKALGNEAVDVLVDLARSDGSGNTVRIGAIRALVRLRHRPDVETVTAALDHAGDDDAAAVAEILGRYRDGIAEDTLLRLLTNDSTAVRIAAARSLGAVGGTRAVMPLLQLEARDDHHDALKGTIREAVERIRARASEIECGKLTVAEPSDEGGALTLAEDDGGLTLASVDRSKKGE